MIYTEGEQYKVKFYINNKTDKSLVLEYIDSLDIKQRAKVSKYIEFLRINRGILHEPYSKHIKGKIWELRVDFGRNKHRIFYFIFIKKTIIFLHAFSKKTKKTPRPEFKKAEENYYDVINNPKIYG